MYKCDCGIDHWNHAVLGLMGIQGMFVQLEAGKVPMSPTALTNLEVWIGKLNDVLARQKELANGRRADQP